MVSPEGQTHFERIAASITNIDSAQGMYERVDSYQDESLEVGQRVEGYLEAADDNVNAAQEEVDSTLKAAQHAYAAVGVAVGSLKEAIKAVDNLCSFVDRSRDYVADAQQNMRTTIPDHENLGLAIRSLRNVSQDGKSFADMAHTDLAAVRAASFEVHPLLQEVTVKTAIFKEKSDEYAGIGQDMSQKISEDDTRELSNMEHELRDNILQRFDTYADPGLTVRLTRELEDVLSVIEESRRGIAKVQEQMRNHSRSLPGLRTGINDIQNKVHDIVRILMANQEIPGDLRSLAAEIKIEARAYLSSEQ